MSNGRVGGCPMVGLAGNVGREAGTRSVGGQNPGSRSRIHGRGPVQAVHILRFVGAFVHQVDFGKAEPGELP